MKTKIEVDIKTFVKFWGVLLGFLMVGLFIWKAWAGILMVLIAGFLAIAISPLVRRIDNLFPGKNRKVATAVAYTIVVGILLLVLAVALPAIIGETVKFVSNLPGLVENARIDWDAVNRFGKGIGVGNIEDVITSGLQAFSTTFVSNFGGVVFGSLGAIGTFLGSGIIVLVMVFLILIEGPSLLKSFWGQMDKRMKGSDMSLAVRIQDKLLRVVSRYVTGQLSVSLVNWSLTTLSILVISLVFGLSWGLALPFGLITGVLAFIPVFGSIVGGILVTVLLAFSSWPAALVFFIYYMIYLQFENNVISPNIQSKSIDLPVLVIIIAITIGFNVMGLFGAIVAIPIAGSLKVIIEEYNNYNKEKQEKKTNC